MPGFTDIWENVSYYRNALRDAVGDAGIGTAVSFKQIGEWTAERQLYHGRPGFLENRRRIPVMIKIFP